MKRAKQKRAKEKQRVNKKEGIDHIMRGQFRPAQLQQQ